MKTKLLFLAALLCSISGFSQSFAIHNIVGGNVTGSTQYSIAGPGVQQVVEYYVVNVSSSAKTVKAYRHEISIASGTMNSITFDAINYIPTIDTSVLASTVQPGDSVYFEGEYYGDTVNSTSIIQYCFFDVQNPTDQSCITQNFETVIVSVAENLLENNPLSFYPQPCSQIIHCQIPSAPIAPDYFMVVDNSGKIIERQTTGQNEKEISIDVSNYSEGVYFVQLIYADGTHCTGKMQVIH